jgi:hypothetical protein
VLADTRGADYVIWGVVALLYVWDAAKLLSARQLLLIEAGDGRFSVAFSESPFTISGKVLAFGPLLLPYRGAFVAPWGRPWVAPAGLSATLQSLARLRESLLVVRVLATWGFVLLFVVGPVLTLMVGPNAAVVYTAIGAYWTVLMAILVVWWQRNAFGLTRAQAGWLSLDLIICPAFLPNLVRKITITWSIDTDGAQLLFSTAASNLKEDFVTRLEARTEGLLDGALSEGPELGELRSYVDVVRAAQ